MHKSKRNILDENKYLYMTKTNSSKTETTVHCSYVEKVTICDTYITKNKLYLSYVSLGQWTK